MATSTFNARLKNKRDTHSNWTTNDPVLLDGEIAIVDTSDGEVKLKIGDGTSTYSQLDYICEPNEMSVLSYGSSTWQDFIDAYNTNSIVYCRASSNANPATGAQTRMAFLAYVNSNPPTTEVEFQYYRSVSTHTASQQGDQVFVYKLNKTTGWSVTTREASVKVVAGTGLGSTYNNGTITLTADASPSSTTPSMDGTAAVGSSDTYARADHVHPTDTSRAPVSHTHVASDITSGLADVATTGDYDDLINTPTTSYVTINTWTAGGS